MKNTEIVASVSPAAPEAVDVYDAHAGKYYDATCHQTIGAPTMALPGTPMPFANIKGGK